MALAERRAIALFQKEKLDNYLDKINQIVGGKITLEINWEQMNVDDTAHFIQDTLVYNFFDPLIYALQQVCIDDFGKEAILTQIKKIVLQNSVSNSPLFNALSYADSILIIDVSPQYQPSNVNDWNQVLSTFIESNLK